MKTIEKWKQNNGEMDPDSKSQFPKSGNLLYSDVKRYKFMFIKSNLSEQIQAMNIDQQIQHQCVINSGNKCFENFKS